MALDALRPRECGGHVVFALRGELDLLDADDVAAALTTALVRHPVIILDLTDLAFIDCYALNALVRVRAQARLADGDLLLAAPHGWVLRILTLTNLIGVFSVRASVPQAGSAALFAGGGAVDPAAWLPRVDGRTGGRVG